MYYLTYAIINGPLVAINFLANLFFIYCLVRTTASGQLRQPLKILLETLVLCTVCNLVSILGKSVCDLKGTDVVFTAAFFLLSLCLFNTSMTSFVWLNFFYYTQIVPAKRALTIWIKKNVKFIIYCAWVFERLWTFTDVSLVLLRLVPYLANSTGHPLNIKMGFFNHIIYVSFITTCILKLYLVLSVLVMVMSTVSISIYLIRHIQRMLASGKTCSSPKFLGQLRVTIAGVVQGLLYFVCAVWNTHKFVEENLSQLVDARVHFTVINVYMLGTTLNLWVGQSVFRQKTVDLFQVFKPGILTKPGATEDPGRLPL